MKKVLFWDFDGTLGGRIDGLFGRAWSASLWEALQQLQVYPHIGTEDILAHLEQGFPWQEPDIAHEELNTADAWWSHVHQIFVKIYTKLHIPEELAHLLARIARERYVDVQRWELYPDTLPVLRALAEQGWTHYVVSNHVPELRSITEQLGVAGVVQEIINSAEVGYEKPNPEIFRIALQRANHPEIAYMIGDNIHADVQGAEGVGIQAILVRNTDASAKIRFENLYEVQRFLGGLHN